MFTWEDVRVLHLGECAFKHGATSAQSLQELRLLLVDDVFDELRVLSHFGKSTSLKSNKTRGMIGALLLIGKHKTKLAHACKPVDQQKAESRFHVELLGASLTRLSTTESTSLENIPGFAPSFSVAYRTARRKIRRKTYLKR